MNIAFDVYLEHNFSSVLKDVNAIERTISLYNNKKFLKDKTKIPSKKKYEDAIKMRSFFKSQWGFENYDKVKKTGLALFSRRKRLKKKILTMNEFFNNYREYLPNMDLYFITLNINDNAMSTMNNDTLLKYIRELFSNSGCIDYVGNFDFAPKTHRKHFHFYALFEEYPQLKDWTKKYKAGGFNVRHVTVNPNSTSNIKRYLIKDDIIDPLIMVNHSCKSEVALLDTKLKNTISKRKPNYDEVLSRHNIDKIIPSNYVEVDLDEDLPF